MNKNIEDIILELQTIKVVSCACIEGFIEPELAEKIIELVQTNPDLIIKII